MSIARGPRPSSNFYNLDKSISEDERLSWGARGLLIFLLGKPDHWRVSTSHLIKQTAGSAKPARRDAVRALIAELIEAGYIIRQPVRDESGAFKGTDYIVSEIPVSPETDSPETDNPAPDEPTPANPPLVSIEGLARNEPPASNETPEPPTSGEPDPVRHVFEYWVEAMGKAGTTKLLAKRKAKIEKALKAYGLDNVKKAIDGCRLSPFNMGDNDKGQPYNDIELILRDEVKIEKFLEAADNPPKPSGRKLPPQRGFDEIDYRAGLSKDENGRYRA